jgi:iron complex outermembrane receptor protein
LVTINGKTQRNKNNGTFPLQVPGVDGPVFELNQDAVTELNDNINNASLSLAYSGSKINFSSQTAYQSNYRFYEDPIDADFSPIDGITIVNNYGDKWNNVKVYTQEFRISAPANSPHRLKWTAGTYFFSQSAPNKQATHFGKDALLLGAPDTDFSIIGTTDAHSKGIAGYGQVTYELFPHLELISGIRYDYERKELSVLGQYQKDPDPNPQFETRPDTSAATTFSAFSPKFGFAYRNANTNMYITYSKGYRTGGLTGFSSDPSQPPLFAYKPEFSHNIELGFKSDWYNNRLKLHSSAFFIAVKDAQVPTLVLPEAITITRNAGSLTSFGLETELDATPVKGLETGWRFGYTHARYTTLNVSANGTAIDLEGKRQVFTPDFTSLLYLQFTQPLNADGSFSVLARGEWIYLGRQYFDLRNTIGQDPYSLFNIRAGVTYQKLEAVFWMRNITDNRYIDYAYDFGAVHLANPKTLGVTLTARF